MPKSVPVPETCHICKKPKGQPPDRCNGHYAGTGDPWVPEPTEPRPEPALGYAIAEQRRCDCGGGCVCGEPGCDRYPPRCEKCDGDGTRWVVTDTRVEPREVVVPSGPTETWWRPTS